MTDGELRLVMEQHLRDRANLKRSAAERAKDVRKKPGVTKAGERE
jgi:hypothetical protein